MCLNEGTSHPIPGNREFLASYGLEILTPKNPISKENLFVVGFFPNYWYKMKTSIHIKNLDLNF